MTNEITVHGGLGQTRASLEDLAWLQSHLSLAGQELREADHALRRLEFDLNHRPPQLQAITGETLGYVSQARHGSNGTTAVKAEVKQLRIGLQTAMAEYARSEQAVTSTMKKKGLSWDTLRLGITFGLSSAPGLNPMLLGAPVAATVLTDAALAKLGWNYLVHNGSFNPAELLRQLHPALEQYLVGFSLLAGNPGPPDSTSISRGVAALLNGAAGGVKPVRLITDSSQTKAGGPARLAEVVHSVGTLSDSRSGKPGQFAIEKVITLQGISWIVEIPGTQTMDVGKGTNPLDMYGNFLAEGQLPTQVGLAVTQALAEAGAQSGEPVMLAGHSQGGIVAAALANDSAFTSRFTVKSVVTLGSPVSEIPVPKNVVALSLQHKEDVIPTLSRAPNPDMPNHIIVNRSLADSADESERNLVSGKQVWKNMLGAHNINSYESTASSIDASTDPSIQAWREVAVPFFSGQTTTRTIYTMERGDG